MQFEQNLGAKVFYTVRLEIDCMAAAVSLTCSHWSDLKFPAHFFRVYVS